MNKKIPMRTCIVTREKLPKKELVRIVRNKDGEVFVDETGKQNGRGVYLKKEINVIIKTYTVDDSTYPTNEPTVTISANELLKLKKASIDLLAYLAYATVYSL